MFVRALNDGNEQFSMTDNLIADLWVLTLQANSNDPDKTPDNHPQREASLAAQREEHAQRLKAKFDERKRHYAERRRLQAKRQGDAKGKRASRPQRILGMRP